MPAARDLCDPRYDGTNLRVLESQMDLQGTSCRPLPKSQASVTLKKAEEEKDTTQPGATPSEKFGMDYEN